MGTTYSATCLTGPTSGPRLAGAGAPARPANPWRAQGPPAGAAIRAGLGSLHSVLGHTHGGPLLPERAGLALQRPLRRGGRRPRLGARRRGGDPRRGRDAGRTSWCAVRLPAGSPRTESIFRPSRVNCGERRSSGVRGLKAREAQPRNPAELPLVEAHKGKVARTRERGDQEVVRTYGRARPLQVRPYDAVLLGRPVIEGEAPEWLEETVEYPQVVLYPLALAGSEVQFGLAHPAQHHLCRCVPAQPLHRLWPRLDERYGRVGVEKKPQGPQPESSEPSGNSSRSS